MNKRQQNEDLQNKQLMVQSKKLELLTSIIQSRSALAARLGKSFGNARDLYETLGYPALNALTIEDFFAKFKRQDIAARAIRAYPEASWERVPTISDESKGESLFEARWGEIAKRLRIYNVFKRADILCGIGQFSVLLLGFDDGAELSEEVRNASELIYIQPFGQLTAKIKKIDDDDKSPRYGYPVSYDISFQEPNAAGDSKRTKNIEVHHSRVVHIAENCLESNIYGTPRLEAIYNRLDDLEKIAGGSAEMFWQGAFQGLAFLAEKDYDVTQTAAEMTAEIDNFVHGFQRRLKLQGIKDVKSLAPNIAGPREHFDIIVDLIASYLGEPKRILLGSERGELASSQDEGEWTSKVEHRREDFNEPVILRPVIDRCIALGVIDEPTGKYTIDWPSLNEPTPGDKANTGKTLADAVKAWYESPIADAGIDLPTFLEVIAGVDRVKVDKIEAAIEQISKELTKEDEEGRAFEASMEEDEE